MHAHTHKFSDKANRLVNFLENIPLLEKIHVASHRNNTQFRFHKQIHMLRS